MDTPQKTQITTPISKFEDSPVFNYINSLSPIKPVKSIHFTQSFQLLGFSSLPSIFTSPHVSSRFLRRHYNSDPSKPEFSSQNDNTVANLEKASLDITQLYDNSSEIQENFDQGVSVGEASAAPPSAHAQKPKYDYSRPENDPTRRYSPQVDRLSGLDGTSALEVCRKSLPEGEANLHGIYSNPSEEMENEMEMSREMVASNLHRGMRRRCLDFEVLGARGKNVSNNSNSSASIGVQSDEKVASKDKQLIPVNSRVDSSRLVLPGIGLHLNALAITSRDTKNVKIEVLSSEMCFSSPFASFQSPSTGQQVNESLALASDLEMDPTGNAVALVEDVSQTSASLITEEFNHSSPKEKRRKLEVENEGCKRCHCKKSKCLKLYCECFAAGVYCIEMCSCQECFNKPIHEDTVLATRKQIESRNPLAFAPKVIRSSESVTVIRDDSNKTPASARHKRGCNCKKSNCLKKYCECYQGGVGCSINCRCEGCKNAFGRKDGSARSEAEAEAEAEEETEEQTNGAEKASQKIEIQNSEEQNPSAIPVTPSSLCRPLLRLPFLSKGKPPRSFLGIGPSSGLYNNEKYGKPNITTEQKFEKQLQTISDDDMPETLRENCSSLGTGTRTSPNSKRVSPPHNIIRRGRKLILQSIPSFPSLTPHF